MKKLLLPLLFLFVLISCGRKLSPDHDWNNKQWVLTEIKGVPVQLSGGNRDAHLEFNTTDKKYSGNGGCNRIAGSYSLGKKNNIHFSDPISTRMACPDIAFENLFISTIKTVDNQTQDGNILLLKRGNEVLLKFQTK